MQEVQDEKEESDLATIRAWRETRTSHGNVRKLLKDHLTTPQCVMWEDLKRWLRNVTQNKPSMEHDARQATLIRGIQRLTRLAEARRTKCWQQNIAQAEVQAVAVKAQKLAMIAQIQVACGSCICRRVSRRLQLESAVGLNRPGQNCWKHFRPTRRCFGGLNHRPWR